MKRRTSKYVSRGILGSVYVRSNGCMRNLQRRMVQDPNRTYHPRSCRYRCGEPYPRHACIVQQGCFRACGKNCQSQGHFFNDNGPGTCHATIPGNAAYAPQTQKNVPKYLTPIETSEMLIVKPMRHKMRPARMKGDRIFHRSERYANVCRRQAEVV